MELAIDSSPDKVMPPSSCRTERREHLHCHVFIPVPCVADRFDIVLLPQDRIEIIEANITDRPDVVISADVIIMNNVFEFFLEPEEQIAVWRFLRQTIKPGTLLVTAPPLEETFSHLQVSVSV